MCSNYLCTTIMWCQQMKRSNYRDKIILENKTAEILQRSTSIFKNREKKERKIITPATF